MGIIINLFLLIFLKYTKKYFSVDFSRATVCLNESIVKKDGSLYWRVVLDCNCANMSFDNGEDKNNNYGSSFCDCENCQTLTTKFEENYGLGGVSCSA